MDGRSGSRGLLRWARLIAVTLLVATLVRSLLFATYVVPSQSMMPTLLTGDVFVASKWSYGWSRYSFSSHVPLFQGRIWGSMPKRGDMVIVAGTGDPGTTYVKRVMALPGDRVEMRQGRFVLNERELPQTGRRPFVIPLGPNVICLSIPGLIDLRTITADARPGCGFIQASERLPSGRLHRVLDFAVARSDTYGPATVPPGHVFLMGDNRDDSLDSRFPIGMGGLGMVPVDNVIGKVRGVVFSSDGTGSLLRPWSWQRSLRPERLGAVR